MNSLKNLTKICVAIKFDDSSRQVVKVAEQFCERTGAAMHLVHVYENILTTNMAIIATHGLIPIPGEILQLAQDNIREEAELKMFEFSKGIKSTVRVSTHVLGATSGTPAELIEAEALSSQSNMIFVGTSPGGHRFVPRGFSCALSLMSHAKLPVMVVNNQQTQDLGSERLQMVIADDLKEQSIAAVVTGCDIAFALRKTDIYQIHINGMTQDTFKAVLDTAQAASHTRPYPALSVGDVYNTIIKQLETQLEKRTQGLNIDLELSGCKYHKALLTDQSVTGCLEKFITQKHANLVVFGRHQTIRRKPFSMGQMPYYAMLALPCPVLVIPSKEN